MNGQDSELMEKGGLWSIKDRELRFSKPLVMGILNVTPDSFSDGGNFATTSQAIKHGYRLLKDGADILDIGGESTRPGAHPVAAEIELSRVLPIVREYSNNTDIIISVDTQKAQIAKAALEAGAHIINDISAGTHDEKMLELIAAQQAGYVMLHMQGTPSTMQQNPHYTDVIKVIRNFFDRRLEQALTNGIRKTQIVFDPGLGFGKTLADNLTILAQMNQFQYLGRPLLLGASRKSFIGLIDGSDPGNRLGGSLAAVLSAYLQAVEIYRVHDVLETCQMLKLFSAIQKHSD